MLKEQWNDIENWEGKYKISNFGRVYSVRKNIFKIPDKNNAGYLRIQLADTRNGKLIRERYFIHRLVAHYFVVGEFEGATVNHIDGNKLNNNADNLEWVTQKENSIHAQRMGLLDKNVQFKEKPYWWVDERGNALCFRSMTDLARSVGYCRSSCYNWLKDKQGKIPNSDFTIVPQMPRDYPEMGVGNYRNGAATNVARYSPILAGMRENLHGLSQASKHV